MKSQAKDSEKIFANYISNKTLVSRIFKEFSKLNKETSRNEQANEQTFHQRGYIDDKYTCEKLFNIIIHYENEN